MGEKYVLNIIRYYFHLHTLATLDSGFWSLGGKNLKDKQEKLGW